MIIDYFFPDRTINTFSTSFFSTTPSIITKKNLSTVFTRLFYLFNYREEKIKQLIEDIKLKGYFDRVSNFSIPFCNAVLWMKEYENWKEPMLISPVTYDIVRYSHRGFHLLEELFETTKVPYQELFCRSMQPEFAKLNKKQRLEKTIMPTLPQTGKIALRSISTVILVDDIITTGTTMYNHARVLKAHFPHISVIGLCLCNADD